MSGVSKICASAGKGTTSVSLAFSETVEHAYLYDGLSF
jgi:hypothetical protein